MTKRNSKNETAKVSPEEQMKRVAARHVTRILNSGYGNHGASRRKKSMIGWNSKGGSPDGDITENLQELRERSRDLYMGAPLATGALKTYRSNVVGPGLKLKSQIDADFLGLSPDEADAWERTTEREFALWAKECDAGRMMDFGEMQSLVFFSAQMSGDVFCGLPMIQRLNNPYMLKVSLIEADRVSTPSNRQDPLIQAGVEVDQFGAPVAYHIAKKHPLDKSPGKVEWDRVPAFGAKTGRRNVLHIMEFERPGQRRGVPLLAPVIESLKQLTRYSDAELMAAVIRAMLTVFIKTKTPEAPLGEGISPDQQVDAADESSYELGNGSIIALAPDEDVTTVNPSGPNNAFDGFIVAMCRQIGAAIELPHELLVKHFTSSYSASRAALLEAWKSFRMRRAWLVSKFCQPVYEEFMFEAVASGRIVAPGFFEDPVIKQAYCGAEWHGPSQGQLDPLKEANGAVVRVEQGFSTRAREAAELTGSDFDNIIRQRKREEKLMKEGGLLSDSKKVLANQSVDNEQQ